MREITNDRIVKAIISSGRRHTISPAAPSWTDRELLRVH